MLLKYLSSLEIAYNFTEYQLANAYDQTARVQHTHIGNITRCKSYKPNEHNARNNYFRRLPCVDRNNLDFI